MTTDGAHAADWRVRVGGDLAAFADVWPALDDAHGHHALAFQCRDVLAVWLDTIGAARRVEPLLVRVDDARGAPVMLLPLALERSGGVRHLVFMDGGVADYNAPVLFPGAAALDAQAMHGLWRRILAALPACDVIAFTKMPGKVGAMDNPLALLGARPDRQSAYLMDLAKPPPATSSGKPFKGISLFRDSDRQRRRLAETGRLAFRIAETAAERARFLAVMQRQKRRRYLETRGIDSFQRPGYLAYYDAMTSRLGPGGQVSLAALYLDETPLAAHWGIVTKRRFYYLMPSYEAGEWSKYSPGSLLMENLVAWCRAQGMESFDLGVGDEPYKLKIAHATVPLLSLTMPQTLAGRAWVATRDLRQRLSDGGLGDRWRALKQRLGRRSATTGGADTGSKG